MDALKFWPRGWLYQHLIHYNSSYSQDSQCARKTLMMQHRWKRSYTTDHLQWNIIAAIITQYVLHLLIITHYVDCWGENRQS